MWLGLAAARHLRHRAVTVQARVAGWRPLLLGARPAATHVRTRTEGNSLHTRNCAAGGCIAMAPADAVDCLETCGKVGQACVPLLCSRTPPARTPARTHACMRHSPALP